MQIAIFVLILLAAVIASGALLKFARVPLPVLQIAIGAALAWPVGGVHIEIEPELFLLLFIPPLLFGDALMAPKRDFLELKLTILSLAFGLVFFTIVALGYALHWLVPAIPLSVAFALAAVLSPTDAVAVSSIIDKNLIPARLVHILEGESLFNDASGLVMFRFATAAALTGSFSLLDASLSFVYAVLAGCAAGLIAVALVSKALKVLNKIGDVAAEIQVLVMLLLPFVAYLIAEEIHASGILAAVAAGLFVARSGAFRHLSVSARMLTTSLWTTLSFVFNGSIFVLLGLQLPAIIRAVPPELTSRHWLLQPLLIVLALTLCLIALRYVWVSTGALAGRVVNWARRRPQKRIGVRLRLAGSIAGVRGAVTLAGVLSLPLVMPDGTPFPARDLAIFLAAGVILCSLAIASLLLPRIARGLVAEGDTGHSIEERHARIAAAEAAIARIEGFAGESDVEPGVVTIRQAAAESLIATYRRRITAFDEGEGIRQEAQAMQRVEREMRQAAIGAERDALRTLLLAGDINDQTALALFNEINMAEALMLKKA